MARKKSFGMRVREHLLRLLEKKAQKGLAEGKYRSPDEYYAVRRKIDKLKKESEADIRKRSMFPVILSRDEGRTIKLMLQDLPRLHKKLEEKLGKNFIGIVVGGSKAGGYAHPGSDVDYMILTRRGVSKKDYSEIMDLSADFLKKAGQQGEHKTSRVVHGPVIVSEEELRKQVQEQVVGEEISELFVGYTALQTTAVEDLKKEIVQEMARAKNPQEYWDNGVREYAAKFFEHLPETSSKTAEWRAKAAGMSVEEYINLAKERIKLIPTWEQLKKKYGIKD